MHDESPVDPKDEIAREAARRLETGRSPSVGHAIRAAAQDLGLAGTPPPGPVLVRRHAQAMRMQALGDVGYRATVRDVLREAEEVMTILETALPDARTLLVGRGARGHVDGGVTLHVRAYTDSPIRDLALALVEHGCAEPSFETADTRKGRFDRLRLVENGQEIVLTRCRPDMWGERGRDLFTLGTIATATVGEVRARVGEA